MSKLNPVRMSSRLGHILTLVWVMVVLIALFVSAISLFSFISPTSFTFHEYPRIIEWQLPDNAAAHLQSTATDDWLVDLNPSFRLSISFKTNSRWMILIFFTTFVLFFSFFIAALTQLIAFLRSISSGKEGFFDPRNPQRLRLIAFFTLIQLLVQTVGQLILDGIASSRILVNGMPVVCQWESLVAYFMGSFLPQLLLVFVLLLIAEAFRQGHKLADESALTI